jgi:hypothetical protein
MVPIKVLVMPDNQREETALPSPVCDGSGRAYPLPKHARAILADGKCVRLFADGAAVPSGAIPLLWRRIQAFNELARASQPPDA